MDDSNLLQNLSQNLLEILDDDEFCDIAIEVGDGTCVKIFRAHMVILNYRSSYLRRIFSTNQKKNDGTLVQIKLPNILPEIFQIILRYIYVGRLPLEEYDAFNIIKIMVAASELNLQDLVVYLQFFLIENKPNWLEQNFNLIYQTSIENDSFFELQKYCTDLMSKVPDKIFKSLDFSTIPEKLFISIIQNDNLQMSEIQVWNHVLKWGIAQNPGLSSTDFSNYSKDDFDSLKNTLQRFIPFIRFYDLTSKEFSDNVMPYKKVLPKELYADLLKTYLNLNPDSKPNVRSNPIIIDDDDDDFDDQNQESVEEPSRKRNTCDITDEKDKSDTVKRPVKILRGRKRLSPYNSFVKTELPKIKAENPGLGHKAAFMRMVDMWKTSPDNPANQAN